MIPGNKVYNEPVSSLDIFSTIAAISHIPLPSDRQYDGVNLLPCLSNDSIPHDIFFWQSGYSMAIRKDDWKLYVNEKNKKTFLFNIVIDPEEKHDLSASQSEKVKELLNALQQWEKTQTIKPLWPNAADVVIEVDGEKYYFPT